MKKKLTTLERLKNSIDINGAAQVSVWLGYRDSRAVQQWLVRREIPRARIAKVEAVLQEHTN